MALIFIYGTLKRGKSNHRFMAGQRFLGPASTLPGYRLYQLDGYPGMIESPSSGASVEGEIWDVDAAALAELDRLEGLSEGLYERVPVKLPAPWDAGKVETYLYLRSVAGRADLGRRFEG